MNAGDLSPMASAAYRLRAFCDAFPDLPNDTQGALAARIPSILDMPAEEVRRKLQELAGVLDLTLVIAARLVSKV